LYWLANRACRKTRRRPDTSCCRQIHEDRPIKDKISFFLNRIKERLWLKPLIVAVLSVIAALTAGMADRFGLESVTPEVSAETNIELLKIMASSMLVIATFAVGSMIMAYGSASTTATPRSFPLVLADDTSQTALSSFIGAFIFSIVALVAVFNSYYGQVAQFALFLLILTVFAWVVVMFVKWVDDIARLGRLGNTIGKVEAAATESLLRRRKQPVLGGIRADSDFSDGTFVNATSIGYVQQVDIEGLQEIAEKHDCEIMVLALPGSFASPAQPVAVVQGLAADSELELAKIGARFRIGGDRIFDNDPRFGLIVLSEIGGRALSPAINDPGTAIDILGTFVRLFATWVDPLEKEGEEPEYDKVHVRPLAIADMVDDAFSLIMRAGSDNVAVAIRLQKCFAALAALGNEGLQDAVIRLSSLSLALNEEQLQLDADINAVRRAAVQK
jgi:uncharacterized membrane protein